MQKIITLTILLIISALSNSLGQNGFFFPNFENTNGLTLISDAYTKNKVLLLTIAQPSQAGAVWYTQNKIQVDKSFRTEFRFLISRNLLSDDQGADGIAFLIHNGSDPRALGAGGGGIGYEGIPNSVAVEFDTWNNDEGSNNHISIQTRGKEPNSTLVDASIGMNRNLPFQLKDSKEHLAIIEYKNKTLSVYLDKNPNPIVSAKVDLATLLDLDNGKAWIGLTAGTGAAFSRHEILRWEMKENIDKPQEIVKVIEKKPDTPVVVKVPEKLEDRVIKKGQAVVVHSRDITIEVWDKNVEDGDIISLNMNGKWLLEKYTLKNKPYILNIHLDSKDNYLVLHALNLGKTPPNTAALTIIDSKRKHQAVLKSNMKTSEAIEIQYKEK